MKLLSRWVAILGIASASLVYPAMNRQMSAHALPEPQVMQILASVPLFVLTDAEGKPLQVPIPDPKDKTKKIQRINFFVSPQDAQEVLNRIRTRNPTIGGSARVTSTTLSNVFDFAKKNSGASIVAPIVPSPTQVQAALALLRQSGEVKDQGGQLVGKDGKPFQMSTPLFVVTNSQNEPVSLQRTVKENGKDKVINVFPFFFNKQDAQAILDQARKQDPKLTSSTKINVMSLTGVIGYLFNSNDPSAGQFELVAPRESFEFMQRQQPTTGTPAGRPAAPRPQAPAAAPSPAAPAAPPARPKPK